MGNIWKHILNELVFHYFPLPVRAWADPTISYPHICDRSGAGGIKEYRSGGWGDALDQQPGRWGSPRMFQDHSVKWKTTRATSSFDDTRGY